MLKYCVDQWEKNRENLREALEQFDFDKDYDSAFYLGDSLNMVGLIEGKEIDLISVNGIVAPDYKPSIKKHFELDKQYDAYVGCTVDYQEMFWEKTRI